MDRSGNTSVRSRSAKNVTTCGLFAALIAIGAFLKISIPIEPWAMNFTLQWFFVIMAGLLLGRRRAFICVSVYLLIGLVGIPVFAAGGGISYVMRPTFGFLLGFDAAATLMGYLMDKHPRTTFRGMLLYTIPGLIVYYLFGMIYFYFISKFVLYMTVGWKIILVNCCLITIGEDFVLCILAALLCARLRPAFLRIMDS